MKSECPVCGPLPGEQVHDLCHRVPVWAAAIPTKDLLTHRTGCGHPTRDHAPMTLRCRTCGQQCGIDCTPPYERIRPWGVPYSVWSAWMTG